MSDAPTPQLPYWPFLVLNVFLAGLALWLLGKILPPRNSAEVFLVMGCLATGALAAWIGCQPFLRNFAAQVRSSENQQLNVAVDRIQKLENLGLQISDATSRWQTAQDSASKTVQTASQISERMLTETRRFEEFMTNSQRSEIGNQNLEIEKLKRGEREWLQAAATIFDHLFALHGAAIQSGQQNVITQLGQFQNACRESVRRVGFNPFIPSVGDTFDPQSQRTVEGETPPSGPATVKSVLACGFTYQGQLIRQALVNCIEPTPDTLQDEIASKSEEPPSPSQITETSTDTDVVSESALDTGSQANSSVENSVTAQTNLPF